MSLENLVGISLESIAADRAAIERLLAATKRNIEHCPGLRNYGASVRATRKPL